MAEFYKKNCSKVDFIFNREKKWQNTYREVSQRLKESIIILKYYEKFMEKVDHVKPYVVKKIVGLQVEYHSEQVNYLFYDEIISIIIFMILI